MNKTLFGYHIGAEIQLDLFSKQLINYGDNLKGDKLSKLKLRDTKLRLLEYLLSQSGNRVIMNKKIMFNVWDKYGLRSSSARLWQVMQDLKLTLSMIGIEDDFITKVENKGYKVKADLVTVLYCDKIIKD